MKVKEAYQGKDCLIELLARSGKDEPHLRGTSKEFLRSKQANFSLKRRIFQPNASLYLIIKEGIRNESS